MAYEHVFFLTAALGVFMAYYGYRLRRYTETIVDRQNANDERGDWSFVRGGDDAGDPPGGERSTASDADAGSAGAGDGAASAGPSKPRPPREDRIAAKERQGFYWAVTGVTLVFVSAAGYVVL